MLEYGPPAELLSETIGNDGDNSNAGGGGGGRSSGHFASMVDSTGDQMAKSLRESAMLGPMKR